MLLSLGLTVCYLSVCFRPPAGLLERPVVLDEGRKRERKKTDRLETSFTTPGSKGKVMNIPEGSGTKLGDIDNVEFQLRKVHGEDLKHLHRVLYSRAGTVSSASIKGNVDISRRQPVIA